MADLGNFKYVNSRVNRYSKSYFIIDEVYRCCYSAPISTFSISKTSETIHKLQGSLKHVGGPRPGPMWEALGISIHIKCDICPSI